jgi:malonyl-CoA O-methyltransferase
MIIQTAYNQWAKTYDADRYITRDLDADLTRRVFSGASFNSILEFGCGTGKNTRLFSELGRKVIALDFSEEMLSGAQTGLNATHVTFQTADISVEWPVPEASQDLISCNLILQHIENLGFVFLQAQRALQVGGRLFISELHPIKKYQGSMARYEHEGEMVCIPAYNHHISDFLRAAATCQLRLVDLNEWWHEEDAGKAPRLVTFLFEK